MSQLSSTVPLMGRQERQCGRAWTECRGFVVVGTQATGVTVVTTSDIYTGNQDSRALPTTRTNGLPAPQAIYHNEIRLTHVYYYIPLPPPFPCLCSKTVPYHGVAWIRAARATPSSPAATSGCEVGHLRAKRAMGVVICGVSHNVRTNQKR